ncbi:MAG: hypothetical protein BGO49_24870 [Planctomycetales bacterium 71-10]|nr:MAG: hypothetical protein BGO49_24870 [Planctomycetales bacterium 71-10]
MARDEEANALWDYLCGELTSQRVLSPVDGPALTALCTAYSRLIAVRSKLEGGELITVNKSSGASKANPLLAVESSLARDVIKYTASLGLNPIARAKIQHLSSPEDDDGWDDDD